LALALGNDMALTTEVLLAFLNVTLSSR